MENSNSEENKHYKHLNDARSQESSLSNIDNNDAHKNCLKRVDSCLRTNPYIKYLMIGLEKTGCSIPKNFFQCRPCASEENQFGAIFSPNEGIMICEDRIGEVKSLQNAVIHELIHAYDFCRVNLDAQNCIHIAYSCFQPEWRVSSGSGNSTRKTAPTSETSSILC